MYIYVYTYVVVRGAANRATFAFDTLPPVLANRNDHVCSELQTSWMPYNKNVCTSRNTHLGRNEEICRGMRVERCQDSYLVPKNSELQAIVHFLLFFFSRKSSTFRCFLIVANRIFFTQKRKSRDEI